jgi:hypothetical protein
MTVSAQKDYNNDRKPVQHPLKTRYFCYFFNIILVDTPNLTLIQYFSSFVNDANVFLCRNLYGNKIRRLEVEAFRNVPLLESL